MENKDLETVIDSSHGIDFKDAPVLNVVRIETYGFNTAVYSATNEKLNDEIFKAGKQKDPNFAITGVPVGYIIHNISTEPIENIIIPDYDITTSPIIGKHKTFTLEPNKCMRIPTKYLVLLLMRLGQGLKLGNGKLEKIKDDLQTDDYDVKMMNYKFVPDNYWTDFFRLDNLDTLEPVGYCVQRGDTYCGLEILQDYLLKLYGYIENIHKDGYKKEENVNKKLLNTAVFWASIFKRNV